MLRNSRVLHSRLSTWTRFVRRFCTQKDGVPDLHKAALAGDAQTVEHLLVGGEAEVDVRDGRGRTALMGAARGGHSHLVDTLLKHGANVNRVCKNGHTAADMALFWQRRECYDLLTTTSSTTSSSTHQLQEGATGHRPMFFSSPSSMLDREASLRQNEPALQALFQDPAARFLLLHQLSPVTQVKGSRLGIFWAPLAELKPQLSPTDFTEVASNAVFLGKYSPKDGDRTSRRLEGVDAGAPLFSLDVSRMTLRELEGLGAGVDVAPGVMGLLGMRQEEAGLCGQARSVLDWHQKNAYCSACGSRTRSAEGGYKRVCGNTTCDTHTGVHNISHPRVDPSVITLVLGPDQESCVLARGRHFPPGMYSCVAGFVEPGESVEQACAREVEEEVGVSLTKVTYVGSQPWPSPSALMLGCMGHAVGTQLTVDDSELEDARWFGRQEVVEMITRCHDDRLFVPPAQAIAHHLVKTWLKDTAFV